MPNWCQNILYITPLTVEADALLKSALEKRELLNTLVPRPVELNDTVADFLSPERLRELAQQGESGFHDNGSRHVSAEERDRRLALIDKYGHDNWYDWNCANWGTKWEADLTSHRPTNHGEPSEYATVICFDTAWCPPIAMLANLDRSQWKFALYYWEPCCWFAGCYDSEVGEKEYANYASIDELEEDAPLTAAAFDCREVMAEWEGE